MVVSRYNLGCTCYRLRSVPEGGSSRARRTGSVLPARLEASKVSNGAFPSENRCGASGVAVWLSVPLWSEPCGIVTSGLLPVRTQCFVDGRFGLRVEFVPVLVQQLAAVIQTLIVAAEMMNGALGTAAQIPAVAKAGTEGAQSDSGQDQYRKPEELMPEQRTGFFQLRFGLVDGVGQAR